MYIVVLLSRCCTIVIVLNESVGNAVAAAAVAVALRFDAYIGPIDWMAMWLEKFIAFSIQPGINKLHTKEKKSKPNVITSTFGAACARSRAISMACTSIGIAANDDDFAPLKCMRCASANLIIYYISIASSSSSFVVCRGEEAQN